MNFSAFAAISELFVTTGVLTVVIHNYRRKGYLWRLAVGVLCFEFFVNMLYMIVRMQEQAQPAGIKEHGSTFVALAAAHGSLSLLVFIFFAICTFLARADFRKGKFFYREHGGLTYTFLALWMLSVGSGEAMYLFGPKPITAQVVATPTV
jgi:hypothetical protein